LAAVAKFHQSAHLLKKLSPPPLLVQLHRVDALAENAIADFTLWFGPLPVRWVAVHSEVDALHGFTDTQQSGPLAAWRHTHRFTAIDANTTRVHEYIVYEYPVGWRGLLARLLFNPLALSFLFWYRGFITRRSLETSQQDS